MRANNPSQKKTLLKTKKKPSGPRPKPPSKARSISRSKSGSRPDEAAGWPKSREVFFRPERMNYVRKINKPKYCVFCNSLQISKKAASNPTARVGSLVLFSNQFAMAILNKFPYNSGHLLILPVRHCGDLTALSKKEHGAVTELVRQSVRILTEVYVPNGLNIGLNLGSAAGAGIPEHLHYHLIPRWNGDTNFFPLIGGAKVVIETLEQSFERLLPFFQELGDDLSKE